MMSKALLVLAALCQGQARDGDFFHDFRDGKPLTEKLTLFGVDAEEYVKPEVGGLRITPPPDGKQTFGWGVAGRFMLSGDFEVTGTYELITTDPPTQGGGVGVALNLEHGQKKFAKIGRFRRSWDGDQYVAESRVGIPDQFRAPHEPTQTRTAQLRFVRKGAMLHFLVADAPDAEFREILQTEFGDEDLDMVRFIANNNKSPTALDVRLLDLTIKSGNLIPAQTLDLSRAGLVQALLVGLLATLLLASIGIWIYTRRRRRAKGADAVASGDQRSEGEMAAMLTLDCAGCGKHLKVKAELAGKKAKCPQCGHASVIPAAKVAES